MGNLQALNRAFEKAFAHTCTRETLMDLLACLGEELSCDRIAIFEMNSDDTFGNTHEWCRDGAAREKELLQGIPSEQLDTWKQRLLDDEVLIVRDLESIALTDPDVYALFHFQQVNSVIVSKLAFHGKGLGFFVLENPKAEVLDETELILPGMRYILSSLVYSDHLVQRLERIGYADRLTGAGNRLSLQQYLDGLSVDEAVGVIYCDVLGWIREDHRPEHLGQDQQILRAGQVMCNIFGDDVVFRVGDQEFVIVISGEDEQHFEESVKLLRNMLTENVLLAAVGKMWMKRCETSFDSLIRQAHMLVYSERQQLLEDHEAQRQQQEHSAPEPKDMAQIRLVRGDHFFRAADQFLSEIFDEPVLTAVIDVNYFKLYNDIFGRRAGNVLLEEIAESIQDEADRFGGVAGYLGGDNFCLMIPVRETEYEKLRHFIHELFNGMKYPDGFTPALGVYISEDRQETMISMYDRALTALAEVKGSYMEHYRFYDAGHFQHMRDDKLMLMDIKQGLPRGEFTFFLQPQVHERTGKIVGAEALVRWKKDGQLISPGRFIPLLEKTGYIFAVDCYVWESVVKWIRRMLDEGIQVPTVSVNVSRVDFYFTDIAEHFINLVERYGLEPTRLSVEITESAFTDNMDNILGAVERLHKAGFRVMMDDFGSGSSSLSMLHTMHLDVLKTDVRFMSKEATDSRAVSIVESVITMAHMIGMLVVTEGVETENQRDSLIALGDNYAQGFYFYRPMPVEQFEELVRNPANLGEPPRRGDQIMTNRLGFRSMIQEGMVSDTLLDNIIGPAAVYRLSEGKLELVQVNEQYSKLTGIRPDQSDQMSHFSERYDQGVAEAFISTLHGADSHPLEGAKGQMNLLKESGEKLPVRLSIFLLFSGESYRLYLATLQEQA